MLHKLLLIVLILPFAASAQPSRLPVKNCPDFPYSYIHVEHHEGYAHGKAFDDYWTYGIVNTQGDTVVAPEYDEIMFVRDYTDSCGYSVDLAILFNNYKTRLVHLKTGDTSEWYSSLEITGDYFVASDTNGISILNRDLETIRHIDKSWANIILSENFSIPFYQVNSNPFYNALDAEMWQVDRKYQGFENPEVITYTNRLEYRDVDGLNDYINWLAKPGNRPEDWILLGLHKIETGKQTKAKYNSIQVQTLGNEIYFWCLKDIIYRKSKKIKHIEFDIYDQNLEHLKSFKLDSNQSLSQYYEQDWYPEFRNMCFPIKKEGKWGAIDASGETRIPFEFDAIGQYHTYGFQVLRNGQMTRLSIEGESILNGYYETIVGIRSNFLIKSRSDSLWTAIDSAGKILIHNISNYNWSHTYLIGDSTKIVSSFYIESNDTLYIVQNGKLYRFDSGNIAFEAETHASYKWLVRNDGSIVISGFDSCYKNYGVYRITFKDRIVLVSEDGSKQAAFYPPQIPHVLSEKRALIKQTGAPQRFFSLETWDWEPEE